MTTEPLPDHGALLAPVVAAAAAGMHDALEGALASALAARCPAGELREAVLMVAPFAGFPRTLDALAALRAALVRAGIAPSPDAAPAAAETHAARGRATFERVYGDDAERVLSRLLDLDPELPRWVLEDAYGRVLSRPGLSFAQRERLAVVLLCALRLRNQLSGHVRGALRCGATPGEVEASLAAAGSLLPVDCVDAARATLLRSRAAGADGGGGSDQQ